jgi:hypothetical protein
VIGQLTFDELAALAFLPTRARTNSSAQRSRSAISMGTPSTTWRSGCRSKRTARGASRAWRGDRPFLGSFYRTPGYRAPGAQILVGGRRAVLAPRLAANAFDATRSRTWRWVRRPESLYRSHADRPWSDRTQTIGQAGMVEIIFGTSSGLSRTAGRAPQRFSQSAPTGAFVISATTRARAGDRGGDRVRLVADGVEFRPLSET